jgi:UPF0755 protein
MKRYSMHGEKRPWKRIAVVCTVVVMLVVVATVIAVRTIYNTNLQPASFSQRSQLFTVKEGDSARIIADNLESQDLIKSGWAFEWYVRNSNARDQLRAGTYSLRQNMTVQEIVTVLTQGKVATDLITILPGQRLAQIRQAFINSGYSSTEVDASLIPDVYKGHPALSDMPKSANLEGYLYPESFQKTADTRLEQVVTLALDELQSKLTPEIRAGFVRQGLTVHQAIIVASIVEQEVSNVSDRSKVAQVFLKRYKENMPLGSDVTAYYGALLAGKKPSVLYKSAYNTHNVTGLPPGPISNVSESSLKAVSSPADSDYLYFVSGDDGITYFSKTNEEHVRLTAEHCKKLCDLE